MYYIIATQVSEKTLYGIEGRGARAACLSASHQAVAALAALCREGDLDPVHLEDVARDWFG